MFFLFWFFFLRELFFRLAAALRHAPTGIRTLKPPVLSRIHIPFWYKGMYFWRPVWVHLRKTLTPGLEPGHPYKDYSRFSKPLPYRLGLCQHLRRRQDLRRHEVPSPLGNLHSLPACLFSGQVLRQLSDCDKTLPAGFEPAHP